MINNKTLNQTENTETNCVIHIEKIINSENFKALALKLFLNPYIPIRVIKEVLLDFPSSDTFVLDEKLNSQIEEAKSNPDKVGIGKRMFQKAIAWQKEVGNLSEHDIQVAFDIYPEFQKQFAPYYYNSPQKIANYLKTYIKGQDEAVESASLVFYMHLLRSKIIEMPTNQDLDQLLPRFTSLLCGKTGTGKTYLVQKLAGLYDIPYEIVNCSTLVTEGFIGPQLSDLFTKLYMIQHPKMKNAIIVLDEFDKLSLNYSKHDIKGKGIQNELLSLLQGSSPIQFKKSFLRDSDSTDILTKGMCFFLLGAFEGMDTVINKRQIGFDPKYSENSCLKTKKVQESLNKYGFLPELIGRLNHFIQFNELTKDSLKSILLESKESPLVAFKAYWKLHGSQLDIDDYQLDELLESSMSLNSGARALELVLLDTYKEKMLNLANNTI